MPRLSDYFTIGELHQYFELDANIGLFWRTRPEITREDKIFNSQFSGKRAGNLNKSTGYVLITIRKNGKRLVVKEHRIIVSMVRGEMVDDVQIDHVDTNRGNNSVGNLRVATGSQNNCNQGIRSDSTSGAKGVCFAKYAGKWRSIIRLNGKSHHLGYFTEKDDAVEAYNSAALKLHGDFARLE